MKYLEPVWESINKHLIKMFVAANLEVELFLGFRSDFYQEPQGEKSDTNLYTTTTMMRWLVEPNYRSR